jgi:hypothetical protein
MQIRIFIDKCFGDKDIIDIVDFTRIIEEFSSEMLLCVPFIYIPY